MPQKNEKHELGFESHSKIHVAQQEYVWEEAAAGATALKRSWDPDSPSTPSKQLPPSKRMIIPPLDLPQTAPEAVKVSYAETVQENRHLME